MKISQKFKAALKLNEESAYRLCQIAEVDPNYVSKIINGIIRPKEGDPRLLRLAKVLQINPDEILEEESNG